MPMPVDQFISQQIGLKFPNRAYWEIDRQNTEYIPRRRPLRTDETITMRKARWHSNNLNKVYETFICCRCKIEIFQYKQTIQRCYIKWKPVCSWCDPLLK